MDRDWWLVTRGDVTLTVAILTALFCSLGVALYSTMEIAPVPIVALSFFYAPLVAVVLWVQKDTRRTGVGAIQDWGYFLMIAWPVLIPWYAFKTRGRSGVAPRPGIAWSRQCTDPDRAGPRVVRMVIVPSSTQSA